MIPRTQRNLVWVNRTYGSRVIGVTGLTSGTRAENYFLVSFWHLWSCLLLKEAQFHTGSYKIGFIKLVSDKSDKIWRHCGQKCVLRAGENRRRRETRLKRFPEFFFGWTGKVFPSLDQGNLVWSNRINDNRSTVYPFLPKMDIMTVFAIFCCFQRYWTGCRSVIGYPI